MNINNLKFNTQNISLEGYNMEQKNNSVDTQKLREIYKLACREILEGDNNPEISFNLVDDYFLFVESAYDRKNPSNIALRLGYSEADDANVNSVRLVKGNKQDILDFLANEKNIDKIKSFMKRLEESQARK